MVSTRPTRQGGDECSRGSSRCRRWNDDEGEDEDILTHADLHREDRCLHESGKSRERRAEAEYQRVEEFYVDAEGAYHCIGGTGADQHAEPRAHDEDIEEEGHRERRPR